MSNIGVISVSSELLDLMLFIPLCLLAFQKMYVNVLSVEHNAARFALYEVGVEPDEVVLVAG